MKLAFFIVCLPLFAFAQSANDYLFSQWSGTQFGKVYLTATPNSFVALDASGLMTTIPTSTYAPITGSTSITTLGTINSGTWNGTTIAVSKGGTGSTSLTSGALLVGGGTTALGTIDVPASGNLLISNGTSWTTTASTSYTGATSITTLGTIATGSWNATAIPLSKIAQGGATSGQQLTWNGSAWAAATYSNSADFDATAYGTPVAWYAARDQGTAEGASLTTLVDRSGNAYNATSGSGITLRMAGGIKGASMVFETGKATLPDGVSVSSQSFTIVAIGRLHAPTSQEIVVSLGRTGAGTGQANFYHVSGNLRMYPSTGSGYNSTVYPVWKTQVVAFTGSASALTMYGDSVSGNASSAGGAMTAMTLTGGKIGESYAGGSTLDGEFSHVIIYNTALSSTTINQIRARVSELYDEGETTSGFILAPCGDSMTQGYGVGANIWTRNLVARLGHAVIHGPAGSNGQTIASAQSPDNYYSASAARKICVVWLGTNDLFASATASTVHTNINTFCTARRTTGWQVIVCSVIPRGDVSWTGSMETQRTTLNSTISSSWSGYADAFVDLASDSRFATPSSTTYFQSDHLHINAAGHAVVAEKIEKAIRSLY